MFNWLSLVFLFVIFTPAAYYYVHLNRLIILPYFRRKRYHVKLPRQYFLQRRIRNRSKATLKSCYSHMHTQQTTKDGRQKERDLLLQHHYEQPDLWVDEEATDNPSSGLTLDLDNIEISFDPIAQFHHIRNLKRMFSSTKRSPRSIMERAYVATMELLGGDASTDIQIYTSSADDLPIVIDTGASVTLTPSAADFVGPISPSHKSRIRGLNSTTIVADVGTIEWSIQDALGTIRVIRTEAYYVPDASIRLFSPQKDFFSGTTTWILVCR